VEAMLAIDPQRAVTLYQDIVLPDFPQPGCQATATPDPTRYYELAAKLFASGFTAKQREKEDDLHFLRQRISGMRSISQVVPVLGMLVAVKVTPEQRKDLAAAFAGALERVTGTDREFTMWE